MKKFLCLLLTMCLLTACGGGEKDNSVDDEICNSAAQSKEEPSANNFCIIDDTDGENYKSIDENGFKAVYNEPLSTFSIDVDTASYSNVRRFLMDGEMPPVDAVRIEELINYFPYDYEEPEMDEPFRMDSRIAECPWNEGHKLARITLNTGALEGDRPKSNLVFLLDVSGSMNASDKLPLLKKSFKLLVNELSEDDYVSIVVYAGAAGVVLPPTSGENKEKILNALDMLQAGGSTAGGEGINLAYKMAGENFIEDGNNRIILATDGDFNVGVRDESGLTDLIEEKRESGIFLSVLGFGTGNLNDATAELLADKGNGNYGYIDSILEAKKVLVEEMGATLYTVARDVKYQVEFNPGKVKGYRLIGYENRIMNSEDFHDDSKDAGEVGAGHSVTAFYEIITADSQEEVPGSQLKYQDKILVDSDEWYTLKVRYKEPNEGRSHLIEIPVEPGESTEPDDEFYFASAVAEFGLLLRNSQNKGDASYKAVMDRAKASKGKDKGGYRAEFIKLVERASLIE